MHSLLTHCSAPTRVLEFYRGSPGLVLETRDVRPGIRRSGPGRSAVAQCTVRQRLCSVRSAWGLRCLYLRCVPVRRWGPRAAVKAV